MRLEQILAFPQQSRHFKQGESVRPASLHASRRRDIRRTMDSQQALSSFLRVSSALSFFSA